MALQNRSYLPRGTVSYATIRGIYHVAEEQGVSFGIALERLLLTAPAFNEAIEAMAKDAPWFEKDVEELKKAIAA